MATANAARTVKEVDPATLSEWLRTGQALLVDVRPPEMFAAERVPGALSLPSGSITPGSFPDLAGRKLVLQCEVGASSMQAARTLLGQGWRDDVYNLSGGLRGWKRAGLPVHASAAAAISLPRQVQITAGGLVVLGVGLGALVSPWFYLLAGFIGAGLIFSGVTGTCGMAAVLARLPHNRR